MAVIANVNPTIYDALALMDPKLNVNANSIAMLLGETNEILEDAVFKEANNGDNNKEVINIKLPTTAVRYYNEAVRPDAGRFASVTDQCAQFYRVFVVDKAIYDLANNKPEFMLAQAKVHIESMNQAMARAMLYGGSSDGKGSILGFMQRYSTLKRVNEDGTLPETADYTIDAGGTSNNLTSILFVVWDYGNGCYGFYPQGSTAGLKQGAIIESDAMVIPEQGGYMPAVKTSFEWKAGLCVKNVKQAVRICNIDLTAINEDDLISMMIDASERLDNPSVGRACVYMNRKTRTVLRQKIVTGGKLAKMFWYTTSKPRLEGVEGRPIMMFDEMPIRRVDAISLNEARVE